MSTRHERIKIMRIPRTVGLNLLRSKFHVHMVGCPASFGALRGLKRNVKANLIEVIPSDGCENIVDQTSRVTKHSARLLDVYFTRVHTQNIFSGVFLYVVSDHMPFLVKFSLKKTNLEN